MKVDPRVIQDISITKVINHGVNWSIYHILHNYNHYIQLFKDGALCGVERFDDENELESKIQRIMHLFSSGGIEDNNLKLSMVKKHTVGDKVIPVSKTATYMKGLDQCEYWKQCNSIGQDYLYVVDVLNGDYVLHSDQPKGYDQSNSYEGNVENGYRGVGNYYREIDVYAYVA